MHMLLINKLEATQDTSQPVTGVDCRATRVLLKTANVFVISEIDKNCQHVCNLSMFCLLGKAAWAARSVDFGHNFYYPFTYTFAIIILSKYNTKEEVKS